MLMKMVLQPATEYSVARNISTAVYHISKGGKFEEG